MALIAGALGGVSGLAGVAVAEFSGRRRDSAAWHREQAVATKNARTEAYLALLSVCNSEYIRVWEMVPFKPDEEGFASARDRLWLLGVSPDVEMAARSVQYALTALQNATADPYDEAATEVPIEQWREEHHPPALAVADCIDELLRTCRRELNALP